MTWKYGILQDLKIAELKKIYQYLFEIILDIENLKYDYLQLSSKNLIKMLAFHNVVIFLLLYLYVKLIAL